MKTLKNQNAITLIALVITIIVLLILAGVTINLTLGNNGIFKTAQQAAKNYTDAQNKELADLNEFENIVDKIAQNPEYDPSLLKLKAGDYVKYDTGTAGIKTFRVLYDATSEYGLQIISDKNIANVTLGGSDWETAKLSYNDAIGTLNKEAMEYKNDKYAIDARCVGSDPTNKNAETTSTVKLPMPKWDETKYVRPSSWKDDDTESRDTDKNYEIDQKYMKAGKIWTTGETYWLASRLVISSATGVSFNLAGVNTDGGFREQFLNYADVAGGIGGNKRSNGLRPCITLKPDIRVTSGDGTSEATSYTLGI